MLIYSSSNILGLTTIYKNHVNIQMFYIICSIFPTWQWLRWLSVMEETFFLTYCWKIKCRSVENPELPYLVIMYSNVSAIEAKCQGTSSITTNPSLWNHEHLNTKCHGNSSHSCADRYFNLNQNGGSTLTSNKTGCTGKKAIIFLTETNRPFYLVILLLCPSVNLYLLH